MGLEPIRQRHTPLKRACLPIPALPRSHILSRFGSVLPDDDIHYITAKNVCQGFFEKKFYFFGEISATAKNRLTNIQMRELTFF